MDQVSYRCGRFRIDASNRRFSRGDTELVLEPKVFALLLQLLSRPGHLLTRDQLLDAVWGHRFVTPSTLNRVVALARRAFADDVDAPKFIQTVHGAGYRYIGPIELEQAAPAELRAKFAPPPSARLPAQLQTLIGRDGEITQMQTLLASGRALTVVGTGGMGKTQCALAFARQQMDHYPDGVWFFDLAPMQRPEEWLQALALALSIPLSAERELLGNVSQALAGRRALLVVDNCDRISAEVGTLVFEILRAADDVKVLATSQQPLNFVGERILRMPPLGLPAIRRPSGEADLREVAAAPAVAMLLTRVESVQPGFALSVSNAPTIVRVCEQLDGMPLALELAAARFAVLSAEQVLERLQHRFRFLVSDVAGLDERHRNLVALLDWSFRLLSSEEQQFLRWLGTFVQGWTVEAAIDLAASLAHSPEVVVDLLTGLANKSLVVIDQGATPPRYRLLESVREFALGQLAASGDEQRARDAHLAVVRKMAEAARQDMLGGRMKERITSLMDEHGNIESALDHAIGAGHDHEAALGIAGALMLYFKCRSEIAAGIRLCQRALAATESRETVERGRALMCLGVLGVHIKAPGLAPDLALASAVRIARRTRDHWTEAYASGYRALWLAEVGRVGETNDNIAATERIAEQLHDDSLRALAGLARGWAHLARGESAEAIASLRTVHDLGSDVHQQHFIDVYIGLALFGLGDYAAAAAQWHEAMHKGIAVRNVRGVAASLEGCGYVAEKLGRLEEAARLLGAAARIREHTGIPLFRFWVSYHEQAGAALRSALGPDRYEAALGEGRKSREEDSVNEAASRLCEFGGCADRHQLLARTPAGS